MGPVETPSATREHLGELERELRAAFSNGCPEWLMKAAHHCAIELERLQMYDAADAEMRAVCKQAELLIGLCRDAAAKHSQTG
jgi:hypothetical protein